MQRLKYSFYILVAVLVLNACKPAGGEFAGSEYMPDMAHSIAYEANVYTDYSLNTWDSASVLTLKELSNPKKPVDGTVPRGYAGVALDAEHASDMMNVMSGKDAVNSISVPPNGSVPYYYDDTEEERNRAIAEIVENPFPISEAGLARGEELYNIFCGICHGEEGNGLGYIYDNEKNPNAKYIAAPANFLVEPHISASNGRYYHAIMYGKNVMGAYKDKISYEERWQVIHYIRSLQADELGLEYNQTSNTFKPEAGTPAGDMKKLAEAEPMHEAGEHQEDAEHGEDHGSGGH
ncbi:MAG TPA: cytochrome c [Saprospiraceae bacterium]|nr:cytochrome c [Saprospiraceae bacterium]